MFWYPIHHTHAAGELNCNVSFMHHCLRVGIRIRIPLWTDSFASFDNSLRLTKYNEYSINVIACIHMSVNALTSFVVSRTYNYQSTLPHEHYIDTSN